MIAGTRKHLVNFRLSDSELERLKLACADNGARSLSDYVREAVLRSIGPGTAPGEVTLSQRAVELETAIQHVRRLVDQIGDTVRRGTSGSLLNGG